MLSKPAYQIAGWVVVGIVCVLVLPIAVAGAVLVAVDEYKLSKHND